jgi:predicted Ser/Thr protein kinase
MRGSTRQLELVATLKNDVFGVVELVRGEEGLCVRRRTRRGRFDPRAVLARMLLARERAALERLAGLAGVPRLSGHDRGRADELVRTHLAGAPLQSAMRIPRDYFDRLDELVAALHARGVCHNDLHKEPNILVGDDGRPALLDFQLASVHSGRRTRTFDVRAGEDLRHAEKHRRRYARHGGLEHGVAPQGAGAGRRRSALARAWRHVGKPTWDWVRGSLGRSRELEGGRPDAGPWPEWSEPVGVRDES